jgi:hypothetical protein
MSEYELVKKNWAPMTILRASNQWRKCRGKNFSRGINFRRPLYVQIVASVALWTQRVTRLLTVALAVSGKHATFKSTFWLDAYIFKYLHRIKIIF